MHCMKCGGLLKNDLLALIEQADNILPLFHLKGGNGIPVVEVISDNPVFMRWRGRVQFELQGIYDRTKDNFIWDTLVILKQDFSGWHDKRSFNDLCGKLLAIKDNIDKYYPNELYIQSNEVKVDMQTKKPKVFISHNQKDKEYVDLLVELLECIGINNKEKLFCSSSTAYGIEFGKLIWEGIEEQFRLYDLFVIFILSDNFYDSTASLNEMGAAWISKTNYISILLPGFNFNQIEGAIDPTKISLKLDEDKSIVKSRLRQLKEQLEGKFNLPPIEPDRWDEKRDHFISAVLNISKAQSHNAINLSEGALKLLYETAIVGANGEILVLKNLDGTTIQVNKKTIFSSFQQQEIWEDYINELLTNKLIGTKADVEGFRSFYVTQSGLQYVDDHTK